MKVTAADCAATQSSSRAADAANMLLLTDRLGKIDQIEAALNLVGPCRIRSVDASADALSRKLVISDVDFGRTPLKGQLHAIFERSREDNAPLLCLLRDPNYPTFTSARDLGATAVLPCWTLPVELAARVRQLLRSGPATAPNSLDEQTLGCVNTVKKTLHSIFSAFQGRTPVSTELLHAGAVAALASVKQLELGGWLNIVRQHDDTTYQHCLLVTGLVASFSIWLGLTPDIQKLSVQAALVHDIGKAAIPTAILNKPGRLSESELAIMRVHPLKGHEMLARQQDIEPRILDIVRHHHEYLDGSGYPDGWRGKQVTHLVRIVTICDIYAALIERRSYKQPIEPVEALTTLDDMGTKLDQGLLAIFREMIMTPSTRGIAA